MNSEIKIGKYTVTVTSEDKIYFPESGITKRELIDYYYQISDLMIPLVKNRLVTMHRFPEGINGQGFYQKDAGEYFPEWISTVPVEKQDGGVVDYVMIQNTATLVYLANQGVITPHIWLSKYDKLNYPDRMIFDLDPGKGGFASVTTMAKYMKAILDELQLTSFVMTTGSKGLHVIVPLNRRSDFDTIRSFAQDIGQLLVNEHDDICTMEIRKDKRDGKLFIDTLRNSWGATGVAPYAVRAKENAPVATPIEWSEIHDPRLKPDSYTIKNIFKRIEKKGNPWKGIERVKGSITQAKKLLAKL